MLFIIDHAAWWHKNTLQWYNHPLHRVHCIQIDRKSPLNGGLHQIRKEINKKQKSATEEKNKNNKNVRIDSKKGLKRVKLAIRVTHIVQHHQWLRWSHKQLHRSINKQRNGNIGT